MTGENSGNITSMESGDETSSGSGYGYEKESDSDSEYYQSVSSVPLSDDSNVSRQEMRRMSRESSSSSSSSMSSISNETADSNIQVFETKRQTAQVIPEAPFAGVLAVLRQLAIAILLPVILVCLIVYALVKCMQGILQLISDACIVLRQLIWLALRVALIPLYILWRLTPKFAQRFITTEYERRVGFRVRRVIGCLSAVRDIIRDLPQILVACTGAGIDTCVKPLQRLLGACCWQHCGTYFHRWVNQPLHDAHINRLIHRVRKLAGFHKKDVAAKKLQSISGESKRRNVRIEMRERHKRQKAKARLASLEIDLQVELAGPKDKHKTKKFQLPDKTRSQAKGTAW
jgi:hypothetical protein